MGSARVGSSQIWRYGIVFLVCGAIIWLVVSSTRDEGLHDAGRPGADADRVETAEAFSQAVRQQILARILSAEASDSELKAAFSEPQVLVQILGWMAQPDSDPGETSNSAFLGEVIEQAAIPSRMERIVRGLKGRPAFRAALGAPDLELRAMRMLQNILMAAVDAALESSAVSTFDPWQWLGARTAGDTLWNALEEDEEVSAAMAALARSGIPLATVSSRIDEVPTPAVKDLIQGLMLALLGSDRVEKVARRSAGERLGQPGESETSGGQHR